MLFSLLLILLCFSVTADTWLSLGEFYEFDPILVQSYELDSWYKATRHLNEVVVTKFANMDVGYWSVSALSRLEISSIKY